MITITVNDIKPVAQQLCDGLAGDWRIMTIVNTPPYTIGETYEIDREYPMIEHEVTEKEMLQILEDNIRNGEQLGE